MPLEDYDSKRDFAQTPEPEPIVRSSAGGNLFVVQKHAARRLHYDVRLELDGALKSWAVPKGPSLDPADKRLAVHVEDHPLDYADFEGTIPAGEYGGGTVMVWDRGVWYPVGEAAADPSAAYREGKLKFRLEGEKLRGAWMLLRLAAKRGERQDNWLLFKERDDEARSGEAAVITATRPDSVASGRTLEEIAAANHGQGPDESAHTAYRPDLGVVPGARRAAAPAIIAPELATLVRRPPEGEAWLHEIKFDGYRITCRIKEGTVRLFTRRGADWTSRFPALSDALRSIPARDAILDGEVVFQTPDGRSSFRRLASALQSGGDADGSIVYHVFDILHLDGYDLTRVPLFRRKELLSQLLGGLSADGRVRYVDHLQGSGEDFYAETCKFALEGEVAKRRDSLYRPGRGRDWLKVKCTHRQEFVICGFSERAGGQGGIGALVLGFRREPEGPLSLAGIVGTGWDERTMGELRARLDALRQDSSSLSTVPKAQWVKGVNWVRPDLVAEIEYLSWDGQGAFRHASFQGLRLDKTACEVVVEHAQGEVPQAFSPPPDALVSSREEALAEAHQLDVPEAAQAPPVGGAAVAAPHVPPAQTAPEKTRRRARSVTVGGVVISNPDRIMYPEMGLTKLELARYYEDIAAWMLPHVSRRPLTIVRCPEGHVSGCFYQKHAVAQFPEAILRVPIAEEAEVATYVAIDSTAGLLSLVQMGVLEFHVWGCHIESLEYPDQVVFDFDPDLSLPFAKVVDAARLMRETLEGLGLRSFVKTTGGKGLHVVAPVLPVQRWDTVKPVTKAIAEALARADPATYTTNMSLKKRSGKIFVDYLRNGRGATSISAFSTRRREGAPVAMPLRWDEIGPNMRADRYTVGNVRRRLSRLHDDPWHGYNDVRQQITPEMEGAANALFASY